MSVREIEVAVERLSPADLQAFTNWFEEFQADLWDKQFEADVKAGKLDHLGKAVDQQFEAGLCKPL